MHFFFLPELNIFLSICKELECEWRNKLVNSEWTSGKAPLRREEGWRAEVSGVFHFRRSLTTPHLYLFRLFSGHLLLPANLVQV